MSGRKLPDIPLSAPEALSQQTAGEITTPSKGNIQGGGGKGGTDGRRRTPMLVAAALAIGLAAAIGFGTFGGAGTSEQPPSAAEVANIQSAWAAATAVGIELSRVTPAQQASAISAMALPSADRDKLIADVEANKVQLVWVTVWDNYSEDGDVVELSSDGVKSTVVLKNAHTTVALPMPQSGVITVRGVRDGGGGGITVGILSGSAPVPIPPMTPNQTLGIPVR